MRLLPYVFVFLSPFFALAEHSPQSINSTIVNTPPKSRRPVVENASQEKEVQSNNSTKRSSNAGSTKTFVTLSLPWGTRMPFLSSCFFRSEDRLITSAVGDKSLREWDLKTGKVVREFPSGLMQVSSNGRFMLVRSNVKKQRLYDLGSGKEIKLETDHFNRIGQILFVGNGEKIIGPYDNGSLGIYSNKGKFLKKIANKFNPFLDKIAVSQDGKKLVIANRDPLRIRTIDLKSGEQTHLKQLDDELKANVKSVAISPRGDRIAVVTNRLIVFDIAKQKKTFDYSPTKEKRSVVPSVVSFSPRGNTLVWGSEAGGVEMLQLPVRQGSFPRRIGELSGVGCLVFSTSGNRIAGGGLEPDGSIAYNRVRVIRIRE